MLQGHPGVVDGLDRNSQDTLSWEGKLRQWPSQMAPPSPEPRTTVWHHPQVPSTTLHGKSV